MSDAKTRTEVDSMGAVQVPADALYGAQTQRAVDNFAISTRRMPRAMIRALGLVKSVAATVNAGLGLLDSNTAAAIAAAADEVAAGRHDGHFPIDVFQTGSGTSSNMNSNEVIATLASRQSGSKVHPNDHVNMGQSSNDVVPTAIHVAACLLAGEELLPAMRHLHDTIGARAKELDDVVTTGRTHLMDAMPVTLGQEFGGWQAQVLLGTGRIESALHNMLALPQGGTAVGTGINADPRFAQAFARELSSRTGLSFRPKENAFEGLSSQDAAVELSGQMKVVAVSLMKIANDLRWMNSGPLAGLGEVALPSLQPGSSIMPGKVNPVIPEAACMVCAQVIGNDAAITIGGQAGNFQLNVMLPMIASNLCESLQILAGASRALADKAITGLTINHESLKANLERNPILVTALNAVLGYEKGAEIAKKAYAEKRPVREVAAELSDIPEDELAKLLDPRALTHGGIVGKS